MSAIENMIRRPLNPLIAALISALVLVGTLVYMVQQRASILRNGTEIILKTAPIDPRDLLRGRYRFALLLARTASRQRRERAQR